MSRQFTATYDAAIFDVFRYADGWMLKKRGEPEPGLVSSTREEAVAIGRRIAERYEHAELIVRGELGDVEERLRLGSAADAGETLNS